jgi:hypothetical protein
MIDREARNALLAAVDDYLRGAIKTFDFDECLVSIRTQDKTVRESASLIWRFYDDIIDHPVKLTRPQWNFCQRLRLILKSDAELSVHRTWNFTAFHAWALAAIIQLPIVLLLAGLGSMFCLIHISIGVVFLWWVHSEQKQPPPPTIIPLAETFPFPDFSSMHSVFESAPTFQKMAYPRDLDPTPIRSNRTIPHLYLPWLICWPVILVLMLVRRNTDYAVVFPGKPLL